MISKSLYDLLGMKGKNSIFKSVFVTDRKTYEGYQIIEVEPYDETFINAIQSESRYDKTTDKIMKKVYNYFNGQDVWLIIYTDEYGKDEILVNDFYMKRFGLL